MIKAEKKQNNVWSINVMYMFILRSLSVLCGVWCVCVFSCFMILMNDEVYLVLFLILSLLFNILFFFVMILFFLLLLFVKVNFSQNIYPPSSEKPFKSILVTFEVQLN